MKSLVWPWVNGKVIALPPPEFTNHPLKLYPALVGVPGEEAIAPPIAVVAFDTVEPPCVLYVTVNPLVAADKVKLSKPIP